MTACMNDLSKFSVNDAHFSEIIAEGGKRIRKRIRLNPLFKPHGETIYRLILDYVDSLRKAGIPLPSIRESKASAEEISFLCDFNGPNILQTIDASRPESLFVEPALLDQVLSILKRAADAKIYFDPHIKNFVADQGKVFYVDFTPPFGQAYFDLRLSVADDHDRNILIPFFGCMHPEVLGYHFAADFMKLDSHYRKIMPRLFPLIKEKGLAADPFEDFIGKAEEIIQKERRREKERIFLL
jgi:hypothetical protein